MEEQSVFKTLNSVNVNDKVEKKSNLTYLSWAWAWSEVKKLYPEATYEVQDFYNADNSTTPYLFNPSLGYMVRTHVTIGDLTHEMWLPVMDGANKAMKDHSYEYIISKWEGGRKVEVKKECEAASMFDINKTIMRCLTKNLAMFGLGLYIYAGEDLPETDEKPEASTPAPTKAPTPPAKKAATSNALFGPTPQQPQFGTPPQQSIATPTPTPSKQPISFVPLNVDDANWKVAMTYVSNNKTTAFPTIIQQLSRKYSITDSVQAEIKKVWESK